MSDLIHFTWEVIEEAALAKCRVDAADTLREGSVFMPHTFGFTTEVLAGGAGIVLNVATEQLKSRAHFDSFVRKFAESPMIGRIEAAGFLALLPRLYAKDLLDVPEVSQFFKVDLVGVLHVEHIYYGVKTWVIDDLREPKWRLHTDGIITKLPPCLPESAYGATKGCS